ncbi:hypothetical protein C5167_045012, partial [Papaver somniferum]
MRIIPKLQVFHNLPVDHGVEISTSFWMRGTLERATAIIINGESSSSSSLAANYSNSDVTSSSDYGSEFVASYLINSCGLTQDKAISASKKLNFKTTSNPDSVISLLKTYGFTHISKLINKSPFILSFNPHKTLKPKPDFLNSKGIYDTELANLFSIALFEEGVPESNISKYLICGPGDFAGDAHKFKGIVEKVKEMGFDHLQTKFLIAIHGLASMSEVNWKKKMELYKRWGWSEDQIQSAFRENPGCMTASEKKIMAVMNFLVNEMGYDSSVVAESPKVFSCKLKERVIPRCSVIKILVSRGLIKEKIVIGTFTKAVDKYFLEKIVIKYEKQVPELMKLFQGYASIERKEAYIGSMCCVQHGELGGFMDRLLQKLPRKRKHKSVYRPATTEWPLLNKLSYCDKLLAISQSSASCSINIIVIAARRTGRLHGQAVARAARADKAQ